MEEQYSVEEILSAVDDLQSFKKVKKADKIVINKSISHKNTGIPSDTLKLIEEAEKTIRTKLQIK